jgi:transposase
VVSPAAARFPFQVRSLFEQALTLRDRYEEGVISQHELWTAAGRLECRLDRLLARGYRSASNRRLVQHLRHEQPHLFTFLRCPGLEATNNAAERALRGVIIARKVWGGNRTWKGARTHEILGSVLRTCRQAGPGCLCPAGGAAALAGGQDSAPCAERPVAVACRASSASP